VDLKCITVKVHIEIFSIVCIKWKYYLIMMDPVFLNKSIE